MPTYEITGPNGSVFEIEGDAPPTEADLTKIFTSDQSAVIPSGPLPTGNLIPQGQEAPGSINQILAGQPLPPTLGNVATLASGAAAEPLAGLAGLASLPFGAEQAAQNIESVRGALTIPPQNQQDIGGLRTIQQAAKPVTDIAQAIERGAGDVGFNIAGPIGGAIGSAVPAALSAAAGFKLPRGRQAPSIQPQTQVAPTQPSPLAPIPGPTPEIQPRQVPAQAQIATPQLEQPTIQMAENAIEVLRAPRGPATEGDSGLFRNESPVQQAIRESIQNNPTNNRAVENILNGAQLVRSRPAARSAIKQGFDEGVTAAVLGGSRTDRVKFNRMIDIVERGIENKAFAQKNRPEDVIGDTILDRFREVVTVNRSAGRNLDGVAKELRGQPVDTTEAVGNFIDGLENLGVSVNSNFRPEFADLSVGEIPGVRGFITSVLRNLNAVQGDAFNAHKLKRILDTQVSFGRSASGLSGEPERLVKNLRRDIDAALDGSFPEYDRVNTQFAESITAINDFTDAAGAKNFNPSSGNVNKFLGTLSRRLLSNVQSRVRLMDSISGLEDVSLRSGNLFDEDIFTQAMMADEIENVFGTFAPKSLQGVTEKAITEAGRVTSSTAFDTGVRVATESAKKLRGINKRNAIKALRELARER